MELLTSTLMLRGKGQLLLNELKTKVEIAIPFILAKEWKTESLLWPLSWDDISTMDCILLPFGFSTVQKEEVWN